MLAAFLSQEEIKALQLAEAQSDKVQKRTPEQIEAIYSHGRPILVSASAGSGKTFVMVERIVDMLKRGVAIKSLFISTFTVKAAGELKERLEQQLAKAIEGAKADRAEDLLKHLSQQLADVQAADIGTMDAFCQKLVKAHGYRLGLSAQFRILQDKSEQDILKKEVFDDLFEDYMAGPSARDFQALVRNFAGKGKDSQGFRTVVDQIYHFIQSTPNPQVWLETAFLPTAEDSVSLFDQERTKGLALVEALEAFFGYHWREEAQYFPKAKYLAGVEQVLGILEPLDASVSLEDLNQALKRVVEVAAASNGRNLVNASRSEETKAIKEAYNEERKPLIEAAKSWCQAIYHLELIGRYQGQAQPLLLLLRDFVKDFQSQYLEKKLGEGALEFADISHLSIRILEEFPEVREAYQASYQEVMVDEYQDTNHTQEALLELLSRGHNRFMVGDIKQSIYRFRQADPQIFYQKFKAYKANPEEGQLIILKENFRSQTEVLTATNLVFSRLMDEAVGEVLYDESHQLIAGSPGQLVVDAENICHYLFYDTDSEATAQADQSGLVFKGEVLALIKEILRLRREEGVSYKDITLLVASRSRNKVLLQAFDHYGIPLVADGGELTYLKSVDVMVMLDTLRVINNPLNDYALVALLKSPMFQFTEDDLARISLQEQPAEPEQDNLAARTEFESSQSLAGDLVFRTKTMSFYDKLCRLAGPDGILLTTSLRDKVKQFLAYLTKWRTYAKGHSLYDLVWQIYHDRFYYDYVGLLPNGDKRQANLYALALRAHQFEQTGFKGLTRFIRMIDKILEHENDLAAVEVPAPKDAVSLMTIHKSKGLQFPYVFILNMDKAFDRKDQQARVILNRETGVGMRYLADVRDEFEPEATRLKQLLVDMPTLSYQANQRQLHLANLSEQMRLLYVAMTRAEKKLYLVGKGSAEKVKEAYDGRLLAGRLPQDKREQWTSFQDWLLATHASLTGESKGQLKLVEVTAEEVSEDQLQALQVGPALPENSLKDNRQSDRIAQALEVLEAVDAINQRYAAAINLPTLRTPSQVKTLYRPLLDQEGLDVMERASKPSQFDWPSLGQEAAPSPTALGSALHQLMQDLDVTKGQVGSTELTQALDRLAVAPAIKAGLDTQKVAAVFETDLGRLILANPDRLHREAPFALLEKDPASGEDVVIRGIIDGYLNLDDRLVLFDYKTDKYKKPAVLVDRYRQQMALYAKALSQAYDQKPVDQYLILLGGSDLDVVKL